MSEREHWILKVSPGRPGNEGPSYAKAMVDVQRMGIGKPTVGEIRREMPTGAVAVPLFLAVVDG